MDNNLFSLFDDQPQNEENISKSKGKKSPKKKTKEQTASNSNLFSFESEANETTIEEETKLLKEEAIEVIVTTNSPSQQEIEPSKLVELDKDTITNSTSNLENSIQVIEQVDETIPGDSLPTQTAADEVLDQVTNTAIVIKQEEKDLDEEKTDDQDEPKDLLIGKENLVQQNIEDEALTNKQEEEESTSDIEEEEEVKITEEQISAQTNTVTEDHHKVDAAPEILEEVDLPSIEDHLLGEIISSDYTMFLEHEEVLLNGTKTSVPTINSTNEVEEVASIPSENEDQQAYASLPEWDLQKKYYSIGEVALLFEVNTSHIRFWSKEFSLRLRTTRKGDRLYTPEDIDKLRLIHELVKVKKHTIKGAKEMLQTQKNKVVEKVDLKENLKELKSLLLGIQKKL